MLGATCNVTVAVRKEDGKMNREQGDGERTVTRVAVHVDMNSDWLGFREVNEAV